MIPLLLREILPSFSICILAPLYFQRTVGGGELMTSQIMLALSPSVNSWGEGALVKVIFSESKHAKHILLLTESHQNPLMVCLWWVDISDTRCNRLLTSSSKISTCKNHYVSYLFFNNLQFPAYTFLHMSFYQYFTQAWVKMNTYYDFDQPLHNSIVLPTNVPLLLSKHLCLCILLSKQKWSISNL